MRKRTRRRVSSALGIDGSAVAVLVVFVFDMGAIFVRADDPVAPVIRGHGATAASAPIEPSGFLVRAAPVERISDLVPENAFLFASWNGGPDGSFSTSQLAALRRALAESGIVAEFARHLGAGIEDAGERERYDIESAYWQRTLAAVPWWELLQREAVFAMRVGLSGRFELLFGFRVADAGERDRALIALRQVLRALCGTVEEYEMLESDRSGVPTTVLHSLVDPSDQACIGGTGDVVVATTSAMLLRESLELCRGQSSHPSFRASADYAVLDRELGGDRGDDVAGFELVYLPREAFIEIASLDVIDAFHVAVSIFETRIDWRFRYSLERKEDAGSPGRSSDNPLARSFADQRDASDLLRWVPKGVASFEVESGARLDLFYDYALNLLEFLSGGPALPELIRRQQSAAKIDIRDDLLRHLTGRGVEFQIPKPAGASGATSAWIFELVDDPESRRAVLAWFEKLAGAIRELGARVDPLALDSIDGAFQVVDSGALLGWFVYFGVAGGRAIIATSEDALRRAAAPPERSILDDERFVSIWSPPEGALDEASFGIVADELAEIGKLLRTVGLLAHLLPDDGEWSLLEPLLVVLPRFHSALDALDFLGAWVGHVTRSGSAYQGSGQIFLRRRREL